MLNKRKSSWGVKATAVAVTAALSLTACSGNGEAPDAGAEDEVTLRFAWWGSDIRHEATQQAIEAFEAQNPNIDVQGEFGDWAGYWDKLATMTAAGDAPDVIQMSDAYMAEYAGRGALLNLSEQEGLNTADLDEKSLASGEIDGVLYGVEAGANAPVVLANTKIFEDAGVELPDDKTWTWDDYTRIAKEITEATPDGVYGASAMTGDPIFNAWLRQRGKSRFTEDGKVGYDASDSAAFLAEVKKQSEEGVTPAPSVITERIGAPLEQTGLGTNQVGMSFIWSNQLPAYQDACGCDLAILRVPSMTGNVEDNGMYLRGSQYYSASAKTAHPEAAAKLIDFLVNDPEAGDIILTERGVPINGEIRDRIQDAISPADAKVLQFISDITPEFGSAAPGPVPVGGGKYDDITHRYVSDVLFGNMTPEEAGEAAVAELKASLAAAG